MATGRLAARLSHPGDTALLIHRIPLLPLLQTLLWHRRRRSSPFSVWWWRPSPACVPSASTGASTTCRATMPLTGAFNRHYFDAFEHRQAWQAANASALSCLTAITSNRSTTVFGHGWAIRSHPSGAALPVPADTGVPPDPLGGEEFLLLVADEAILWPFGRAASSVHSRASLERHRGRAEGDRQPGPLSPVTGHLLAGGDPPRRYRPLSAKANGRTAAKRGGMTGRRSRSKLDSHFMSGDATVSRNPVWDWPWAAVRPEDGPTSASSVP